MEDEFSLPPVETPEADLWLPKRPELEHMTTPFENLFTKLREEMLHHGDEQMQLAAPHLTADDVCVYIANDRDDGVNFNLIADYEVSIPTEEEPLSEFINPQDLVVDSMNGLDTLDRYLLGTEIIRTYVEYFACMLRAWQNGEIDAQEYHMYTFTHPRFHTEIMDHVRELYQKILKGRLEPWHYE
ncbi:MAG TPA: hypothetical protein VHA78_01885 [Candidatus Peribacteraceae bacterium]|nr:hypothetical protein [Candidatus Peribacteraceae bacterium]